VELEWCKNRRCFHGILRVSYWIIFVSVRYIFESSLYFKVQSQKNLNCCFRKTASSASRCFLNARRPLSVILYLVFGFRSTNDLLTEIYFSRSNALMCEARLPSVTPRSSFRELKSYDWFETSTDMI